MFRTNQPMRHNDPVKPSLPSGKLGTRLKWAVIGTLLFATLLKFYVALTAPNSPDSLAFLEFLREIRNNGTTGIYHFRGFNNNIFNFPPMMLFVVEGLGKIADRSGLPFTFWLRSLSSVADIGSFFLVFSLLRARRHSFPLLWLLAICPTSILTNGYEGNVDGLMVLFILLAIWLIQTKRPLWTAGIALGMAINVKFVPLMLVPAFFFFLKSIRARIEFFSALGTTIALASISLVTQGWYVFKNVVVGYSGIYGLWGLTRLAVVFTNPPRFAHPPYEPLGDHAIFAGILKYSMLATVVFVSWFLNREWARPRPSLFMQCGVVVATFLCMTPGFGVQYLIWLVPFAPAAGILATISYYGTSSLLYYVAFSDGDVLGMLGLCWLTTVFVLWRFLHVLRRTDESESAIR